MMERLKMKTFARMVQEDHDATPHFAVVKAFTDGVFAESFCVIQILERPRQIIQILERLGTNNRKTWHR